MKLYYAPGLCSLAPHIVLREAGLRFALEQVIYLEKKTESGADYWGINPKGQVPVLELAAGERLTECAVILQFIADQKPDTGLIPDRGSFERYRTQEWLNFIASELHKSFVPMFRPSTPDEYKRITRESLVQRFGWIDGYLAGRDFLIGTTFTIADAYLFTVMRWCARIGVGLSAWVNLHAYMDRIAARPAVRAAMQAEGLTPPERA
jgi:glutathione S-transferase